jgi:hypothetical protein
MEWVKYDSVLRNREGGLEVKKNYVLSLIAAIWLGLPSNLPVEDLRSCTEVILFSKFELVL